MTSIFILIFACSTMSDVSLTHNTQAMYTINNYPSCVSEIKVLKSEAEVLDYMNSTVRKEISVNFFTAGERTPSQIYRYDKNGLKEFRIDPVYDVKQKTVEERTLKGYRMEAK